MKFIATLSEIEKLLRNHYDLPQGTQIVITRPRKRKAKVDAPVMTLTPVMPKHISIALRLIDGYMANPNVTIGHTSAKIEAIKYLRGDSRMGLREAKDSVENWTEFRKFVMDNKRYPEVSYVNGKVLFY